MKGFVKFLALILAAFALGAGAAWLQHPHSLNAPAEQVEESAPDAAQLASETNARIAKRNAASAAADTTLPATDTTPAAADNTMAAVTPESKPTAAAEASAAEKAAATPTFTLGQSVAAASGDTGAAGKPAKVDPVVPTGVGGGFSLIDHNGNDVTEKSWPGKYLLVFFGFTHCPDICPITLDKLTSVLDSLGPDASKVQTLYITVDPARDTVEVMKDYVGHFHKSMLGLTGTDEQVKAAEDAYKVYAERRTLPNGSDYAFDHSAFVYFMSPDSKLAEIIKVEDKPSEITDKIKLWLDGVKKQATP